ncbi:MAG: EamA family transporter [Acidobacteria bacterium]|nr:EamA family transporter [Acidobacteriota bacterium]
MENLPKTHKFPPVLFVVFGVLLWSTGGLFIKLTTLDAVHVNFGRALFASITVGIFIAVKKQLRFDWLVLFSSLFYAATLTAFVYANKNTTAANAIFLQYTAPIYILVFAPLILKEKFRLLDLLTVTVCLIGMSLFFLEAPNAQNKLATNIFAGNIAGLISGVCLGLYFIFLRHPRSLKFNPALSVLYGNLIIVVFMLPLILINPQTPAPVDLFALLYLGIFQIGFAYLLFTYGVANGVRSLDASIIGFIEPLLNPVWVFLFIKETPSKWAVLGGLIVISAVVFHTFSKGRS